MKGPFILAKDLAGQLPCIVTRVVQDEQAVSEDALPRISGAHVRICVGACAHLCGSS